MPRAAWADASGSSRGKRGDHVALLARRHDRLTDAAKEAGPGTLAIACDVTDESACHAAIDEAAAGLGGIDALVYATGIGPLGPVESIDATTGAAPSTPTWSARRW